MSRRIGSPGGERSEISANHFEYPDLPEVAVPWEDWPAIYLADCFGEPSALIWTQFFSRLSDRGYSWDDSDAFNCAYLLLLSERAGKHPSVFVAE